MMQPRRTLSSVVVPSLTPDGYNIYVDSMNRNQTEYLLDKDHVECLLTGYSAELRMRVIKRWHELEAEIATQ